MSVRPRPVTATVTKPKWMTEPPEYMRPSIDLDSSGSTESLVSVLDHDSYESDGSEDMQTKPEKDKKNVKKRRTKIFLNKQKEVEGDIESHKLNETFEKSDVSEELNDSKLSPWELWLIEKTKEERTKRRLSSEKKKEDKMKKKTEEIEKGLKLKKADEKREEWLSEKAKQEKLRKKLQKLNLQSAEQKKFVKEKEIEVRSIEKYEEWLKIKRKEDKDKKKLDNKKKKDENVKQKEKQEKAEKAFKKWTRKASKRPKTAPSSLGYCGGKLKGYYDQNAYPVPSYINPVPWHDPPIPKQKQERKSQPIPKPKYKWDPDKYL